MYKIAIIGYGYVGKSQLGLWISNEHYSVIIYDPAQTLTTKEEVNSCDLAIVCVPTSQKSDGSCDISIVEEVISWIQTPVIEIKSTVPPGTTDYLCRKYKKRIIFSPEFIGEGKYYDRYNYSDNVIATPYFIFGGVREDCRYVFNLLVKITGPSKKYQFVSSREAEMTKYVNNCFLATKVTFSNEIKKICEAMKIDYEVVRELWTLDPRVNKSHTIVFENERGFGGKCLPKDLSALVKHSQIYNYDPQFLKEVQKSNERFKEE